MQLVTFARGGAARLGAILGDCVVDLQRFAQAAEPSVRIGRTPFPSSLLALIQGGETVWRRAAELLGRSERSGRSEASYPLAEVSVLPPIPRPPKNVLCLGRNYRPHIDEAARARGTEIPVPTDPVVFTKAATALIGHGEPIELDPEISTQMDWEAELAVVIGQGGRDIPREEALRHVFGYTVLNDVSARDLQTRHVQWFIGKSVDRSSPVGPWIVTADEIPDPQALTVRCRVNGVTKQEARTADMIFDVATIIAILSRTLTLEPGDVISTGTPDGVGFARTPPEFLQAGDVLETEVTGVGLLRNPVVRRPGRSASTARA